MTYSFSAYIDLTEAGSYSFYKNFDDSGYIFVTPVNADGTLGERQTLLSDEAWGNVTYTDAISLAAGKYLLDVRAGQGGGGVGPTTNGQYMGLGIKAGEKTSNYTDYSPIDIDENSSIAGIDAIKVYSNKVTISSATQIADGATLTLTSKYKGGMEFTQGISGGRSKKRIARTTSRKRRVDIRQLVVACSLHSLIER